MIELPRLPLPPWPAAVPDPLRRCRVTRDTEAITTISPDEADPTTVGMTRADVDRIWESVDRLYGSGMHPAIALCVRRDGATIMDLEIDLTLGFPFRYGMGFMLGAKTFSLYGPDTTTAFGHLGFTNIIGWTDPERRVSGALLTSGKPILAHHLYDLWDVMRQIAHAAPADGTADSPLLHA